MYINNIKITQLRLMLYHFPRIDAYKSYNI